METKSFALHSEALRKMWNLFIFFLIMISGCDEQTYHQSKELMGEKKKEIKTAIGHCTGYTKSQEF